MSNQEQPSWTEAASLSTRNEATALKMVSAKCVHEK